MKDSYQSYVFTGLLATLLVVSFTGCEKAEDTAGSRQSMEGANVNSTIDTNTDINTNESSVDTAQQTFDLQLASKVRQAIADEEALAEFDIAVSATNGVIQLAGEVETREDHDLVMKVTRDVSGVNQISDLLRVKQ